MYMHALMHTTWNLHAPLCLWHSDIDSYSTLSCCFAQLFTEALFYVLPLMLAIFAGHTRYTRKGMPNKFEAS